MENKLFLELVSPVKTVVSMEVDEVIGRGIEGEFGILPGHASFFTALVPGGFTYVVDNIRHHVFISKGFFEVADDKIIVLAETAEASPDIDIKHAKELIEKMSDVLANNKGLDDEKVKEAQAIIDVQLERIATAEAHNNQ